MERYDLCVVGAGPGGISAAIRAARTGARVALADSGFLGGTCLNRGCIPSRALGTTAKLMHQMRRSQNLGIELTGSLQVSLAAVVARKERIVRRLRGGLAALIEKNGVTWMEGEASLQSAHEVEVKLPHGRTGITAKGIILATGSRAGGLPNCPVDGRVVVTSDELLKEVELPKDLVVVGAGVVGSEFASYFSDLGVSVTLVEAADRVLPLEDSKISEAFHQSLKRRGVTVLTGSPVDSVRLTTSGKAEVFLKETSTALTADKVLVASGRKAQPPAGCEALGLTLEKGGIPADSELRTRLPHIFAVGDLLAGYQLACTASYEGALAAENALGGCRKVDYAVVPEVIYTDPEIASVGLNPDEARTRGREIRVSTLSLTGFARAQTLEESEGFVQVVADRKEGTLLGAQMIGARATDLIGEAALAVKRGLTLRDLAETIHGHPTMSESLWEASAMALGQSIYYAAND
jgi:dihydrolipoamide dehydrogenase